MVRHRDYGVLHREDFARWPRSMKRGARCAAVPITTSRARPFLSKRGGQRTKDRGLRWGHSTLWVRSAACPMAHTSKEGHRAAQRAYSEGRLAAMQTVIILVSDH